LPLTDLMQWFVDDIKSLAIPIFIQRCRG
jgi:hypothetical protein